MSQSAARSEPAARRSLSAEHRAAIAAGRVENRVVGAYLEALANHKPRRGRKRTVESVDRRLEAIEQELPSADALTRLNLMQERADLTVEREQLAAVMGPERFVDDFIVHAASYAERHQIAYRTWREFGVPADVLERAGIRRTP